MKTHKPTQARFPLGQNLAISITSLLLVIAFSSPLSHASGATKFHFESVEKLAPIGPPRKSWVSDDGVQHTRGLPVAGPVWGDINGTLTVIANINLDLATGDGTAHGTFVLKVEWKGLTGTFEGRSQWKYDGFRIVAGQGSARGTGDFEGMRMKANFFTAEDGTTPLIGTIFIPHNGKGDGHDDDDDENGKNKGRDHDDDD